MLYVFTHDINDDDDSVFFFIFFFFLDFNLYYSIFYQHFLSYGIKLKFQKNWTEEVKYSSSENMAKIPIRSPSSPLYNLHPSIHPSILAFISIFYPLYIWGITIIIFLAFFRDLLWHFYCSFLFQKTQEEVFLLY